MEIRLDSVVKHYATPVGAVHALEGISLECEAGASLAIMGPSGCGKSTLLGLIGALEVPSFGTVEIGGRDISALSDRERALLRREAFGFVFQSDNLQPFLTATENVALQLAMDGATAGFERCLELLAELGLADDVDKLPDQLSGGQRQRVAVARALIHRPRVILADEPTGALDEENSGFVADLLLTAQATLGATLVVVTHDARLAARLDRTLNLRDGRLVDAGEPEPTAGTPSA
jgi:putative ABC transport system ATP-binding protein